MKTEDVNYNKIIRVLRNSHPEAGTNDIVREVMAGMAKRSMDDMLIHRIIDFLFGWVYIGWVRRSLVAVSLILVGLFVWQQNRILNQISSLRSQVIMNNRETAYDPSFSLEKKLALYRMSGIGSGFISNKETNTVPDSLMEIRSKYRDLIKLIEEDPELRRMIEKKLNNKTIGKFNTKLIKPNV